MYIKIITNIFFVIILAVLQIAFISALPLSLNYLLLPILAFVVFLIFGAGLNFVLLLAFELGFIFDIFYFSVFGLYTFSFFLTVLLLYFLLINFFTNRSLYSFIFLIILGIIFYLFFAYLYNFISGTELFQLNISFFKILSKQLFVNAVVAFFVFYLINYLSIGFKPFFINPKGDL